ncbi:uncharacterized protein F4822DRAFT_302046 [Hypoxylon trugodes]|uniref:uncharacterized protein n=1 Tax=Hypoxylon trugodes TaxID=326681 RepID=UPI00219A3B6D|nr:uncharacterized protein F4822DRAFT_302046 [Hypoxylon trugodes]KAI1388093.1 hypothetical protein F4822DRAFT_302046 [Hypoxylon trugodes]
MSGTVAWVPSPNSRSVSGDKESRGTKRKAKANPYDEIEEDEPIQKTPLTHRNRTRISSETPSSNSKGRPTSVANSSKRRSRSLGVRKDDHVDATANLARAQEPEAARLQPQPQEETPQNPLVPEADMGVPDFSKEDNAATAPDIPVSNGFKPYNDTSTKSKAKGKEKATTTATTTTTTTTTNLDQANTNQGDPDPREEHEVHAILQHRMTRDGSGRVELLIHWEGETEEEATWELEEEIQKGADEILYAYWKSQSGRSAALFFRPKDPPPETYHVFNILNHKKRMRGGFEFEVQWVGHSTTPGETSMEAESKLRKIAPALLDKYWANKGGRDKFLAKRGRNKHLRTE